MMNVKVGDGGVRFSPYWMDEVQKNLIDCLSQFLADLMFQGSGLHPVP